MCLFPVGFFNFKIDFQNVYLLKVLQVHVPVHVHGTQCTCT